MNHIVCGPEVAALLNLMSTPILKKNSKNELFSYKATEYFGKY